MKKRNILYLMACLVVFSLLLGNCNKDDDNEQLSSMTATIEGSSWSATNYAYNIVSDTLTSIIGWNGSAYLGLNLMNVTGAGNYDLGIHAPNTGTYSEDGQATFYVSRQGWAEITENSATRLKGTFEFLAVKSATSDTILVDNGSFDVLKSD
ncbi:MAG: hypothetical protein JSV22_09550 [Bacteroidales bacterium]|nr:MAG: hypothetical protein JSV22_09550 [Bacteroidales bacterium]